MRTLYLAWQDKYQAAPGGAGSRQWFPIGRLQSNEDRSLYTFQYTRGSARAKEKAGFSPLDSFPDWGKVYESTELFPLFQNRVPSPKRQDFPEFVHRLGLTTESADPFEILAVSGGGRQTDNLEVFPQIQKQEDGTFKCRFFLHGWRHTNEAAQARLQTLSDGEELRVAIEINNPASGEAIQLLSTDYYMLGWAPRYLITDMLQAMKSPSQIAAKVVQLNPAPAPYNQRVLVEISGSMAPDTEPMSAADFQPLVM